MGDAFVEMALVPTGKAKKAFVSGVQGAKRAEAEVAEAAGYKPAPDGLSSPVDVTRSASSASSSSGSSGSALIV